MNRYPVWKYAVLVIALLVSALYALPNFFGESPAVQVSVVRASVKLDGATMARIEEALKANGLAAQSIALDGASIKARFTGTEEQLKAKDAIQKALNPDADNPAYVVALNLLSRSPAWLTFLRASPMYLGLDLRGGVHFMLQVDMQAALSKRAESLAGDIRSALREKKVRHDGITRSGQNIEIRFRDAAAADVVKRIIKDQFPDLVTADAAEGTQFTLVASITPLAAS